MANYLDKSNIERQPLKNNFLKRVIIRFDFTSIVNMQSVLDNIVAYLQSLKESFGSFDQMTAPQEEIEKYGGLGNGDNKEDRPFIYRFSDCQIEPKQDVTLDFEGVQFAITAFLNPVIGDLIIQKGAGIMDKIQIENANSNIVNKIVIVRDGALLKREDDENK